MTLGQRTRGSWSQGRWTRGRYFPKRVDTRADHLIHTLAWTPWTDFPGGGGGGGGVQTPAGSGKHPPENVENPQKNWKPPRNFTDFQYSQLQFRLFHYDEIILTAKA